MILYPKPPHSFSNPAYPKPSMGISSLSRFISYTNLVKSPPFLLSTKIPLSTNLSRAEIYYTHLLKYPQNPEKSLLGVRVQLDAPCVNQVLNRCSLKEPQLGLRFFIWAGAQSKHRHSPYMYSQACKLFDIKQNPHMITELIEAYRDEGCAINVKMFKVILSLCKEARLADTALWVMRKMEEFNCRPDSTMYNVVIWLFCDKGDLDMASGLMREMEATNLFPDMITYMSILKGLCNSGRLEDACQLFKAMKRHGCSPNVVAYSTLLDALCRYGSFERALELLTEMEKEVGECTPNVITYTSLIQSYCEKGRSIEALSILDRMESCNCSPNRITVSVLIKGLCTEGHIDEAYKLINRIVSGGHVSSSECYSFLVIDLLRIGRFKEAEKLFRWMLDGAMRPDGLACSMLMKVMCSRGRFLDAFHLYEEVENKGCVLTIDSDTYLVLLVGLCQQDHVLEVEKLASFMVERGIGIQAPYINVMNEHLRGSIEMESFSQLCKMIRRR